MSDDLMNEIAAAKDKSSIIMVVGVGGAGGNAVNHMWNLGIKDVGFMVCNTDAQALDNSPVEEKVQLGREGLGAGNDPENGRKAAIESLDDIRRRLEAAGTRMLFVTAGMGGGTGTGASPVIAKLAHEMGILTVGIVTSPLAVEGKIRYEQAFRGIEELSRNVDSLLVINNENIVEMYGRLSLKQAFGKADDILASAAKGIAEIITVESDMVNVDFADVSKVMRDSGRAHMSVATAEGEHRAAEVARASLESPLLDHTLISGAKKHPAEHLDLRRRFAGAGRGDGDPEIHPVARQRTGPPTARCTTPTSSGARASNRSWGGASSWSSWRRDSTARRSSAPRNRSSRPPTSSPRSPAKRTRCSNRSNRAPCRRCGP